MPRHIKFGLIFFGLLMVMGMAYYYNLQQRISRLVRPAQEPPQHYVTGQPVFPKTAPLKKVKLFFLSPNTDGLLEAEEREIHISDQVATEAKQIIVELIVGSKEGRKPVLPVDTRLREVYVTAEGMAVVDLTKEASQNHPGGLTQEVSSIYSIVNSLTDNLHSIQTVQILIEGSEVETLAGHVDLGKPFLQDLSMTTLKGDL